MDTSLFTYYLWKRIFLFFDEWLFYVVLIYLFNRGYYKILPFVMVYGISCIYTSYANINRIEEKLVDIHQLIWLSDQLSSRPILNHVYNISMSCLDYLKKLIY